MRRRPAPDAVLWSPRGPERHQSASRLGGQGVRGWGWAGRRQIVKVRARIASHAALLPAASFSPSSTPLPPPRPPSLPSSCPSSLSPLLTFSLPHFPSLPPSLLRKLGVKPLGEASLAFQWSAPPKAIEGPCAWAPAHSLSLTLHPSFQDLHLLSSAFGGHTLSLEAAGSGHAANLSL